MFDTDLGREYETAVDRLGLNPCDFCDDDTRAWLRDIGAAHDWAADLD